MYVRTPISGKKITNSVQPAFAQPDRSRRPNMSARTMIKSQIQITQAKKMNIVHMMSRNGYDEASIYSTFLSKCFRFLLRRDPPATAARLHRPDGMNPRQL